MWGMGSRNPTNTVINCRVKRRNELNEQNLLKLYYMVESLSIAITYTPIGGDLTTASVKMPETIYM